MTVDDLGQGWPLCRLSTKNGRRNFLSKSGHGHNPVVEEPDILTALRHHLLKKLAPSP